MLCDREPPSSLPLGQHWALSEFLTLLVRLHLAAAQRCARRLLSNFWLSQRSLPRPGSRFWFRAPACFVSELSPNPFSEGRVGPAWDSAKLHPSPSLEAPLWFNSPRSQSDSLRKQNQFGTSHPDRCPARDGRFPGELELGRYPRTQAALLPDSVMFLVISRTLQMGLGFEADGGGTR